MIHSTCIISFKVVPLHVGCVAARMVMVRECDDARENVDESEAARLVIGGSSGGGGLASSPVVPLLGMVGVIFARAVGWQGLWSMHFTRRMDLRAHIHTAHFTQPPSQHASIV